MANINALHLRHKEEIESSIQSVIDKAAFIKGEEVATFEQDLESYLNVPHAISCGSGTDALTIAMMALGLERGDEVIMPSFAYAALPEAALLLGIKPVFVDINENYLLDVEYWRLL
jgi:UDP-2-acetamido-2-deoxy-ribo-hexuluronate aminotransferase